MKKLLKALFAPLMGALLLFSSVFALGFGGPIGEPTGTNIDENGNNINVPCATGEREASLTERQQLLVATEPDTLCIDSSGNRIGRFETATPSTVYYD
jgi:hypothetical protein